MGAFWERERAGSGTSFDLFVLFCPFPCSRVGVDEFELRELSIEMRTFMLKLLHVLPWSTPPPPPPPPQLMSSTAIAAAVVSVMLAIVMVILAMVILAMAILVARIAIARIAITRKASWLSRFWLRLRDLEAEMAPAPDMASQEAAGSDPVMHQAGH